MAERATAAGAERTAPVGTAVQSGAQPDRAERPASVHQRLVGLRKELNSLVALHHHRTGKPHGVIHGELRRNCGGPPTGMASADQLQERIAALRSWR